MAPDEGCGESHDPHPNPLPQGRERGLEPRRLAGEGFNFVHPISLRGARPCDPPPLVPSEGMSDPALLLQTPAPRISFVSLGCPKALVDSERIITQLRAEGYELSRSHAGADAVIVNTCGFLDSAKKESLQAIGEAMNENGRVIVTGCMGAEPEAIRDAFPNVLGVTGPQAFESVMAAVRAAAPAPRDKFVDLIPGEGVRLTPRHYAYLKIAEGCDNR